MGPRVDSVASSGSFTLPLRSRAARSSQSVSRLPPPLGCLVRYALNNACLKEKGVPELREIWIRLHYGDQPKPKGTGQLVT